MWKDRRLLLAGTVTVVAIAGAAFAVARPQFSKPLRSTAGNVAPVTAGESTGGPALHLVAYSGPEAPNELGMVPVLEYHDVGPTEGRWQRSIANFKGDLQWLYDNDYVPTTTADMIAGFPDVPAGKKPVVITFDDARKSQFVAAGIGPDGEAIPTPDCAVGIMMNFAKTHPGFGPHASFYLLPSFFEQDQYAAAKLKFLEHHGFELGNHTWSHMQIGKASPLRIRSELSRLQAAVQKELGQPDFRTLTLALPDGITPKSPAQIAAAVGGGKAPYHIEAMLLVGANPALSPFDKHFAPLKVARIQAIDSQWKLWFGRTPGHVGIDHESFHPYVSDGNPATITFPEKYADRLNPALSGKYKIQAYKPGQAPLVAVAGTASLSPAQQQAAASPPSAAPAVQATASAKPADAQASGSTSASASVAAAGVTTIPGFSAPLPPGGIYKNGHIYHKVKPGQDLDALLDRYLPFTMAYTTHDLRLAVMKVNHLKHPWVNPGQTIEIPEALSAPLHATPDGWPATKPVMGIYCTSTTAGMDRIFELARQIQAVGGNSVVFDAKDGPVSFLPSDPKVRAMSEWDHTIVDLPKLVYLLHKMGIHVIARQVLFHDPVLATRRHDLDVHRKSDPSAVWLEHGKLDWVDANQPEVQEYNLRLAKELAESGVDEIQFDYVRFPAQGDTKDCKFSFNPNVEPKWQVLASFLKRAHDELKPYHVLLGIDVYGVMAWNKMVDQDVTGQRIQALAKYVDVISPMLYPSHFYGPFDGYSHPGDHPYYFVSQGVARVLFDTNPLPVVVRPWVQAFEYLSPNFSPRYVERELQAARDAHGVGWLLWNAGNKYDIATSGVARWNRDQSRIPPVAVRIKGLEPPAKHVAAKPPTKTASARR